MEEKYLEIVDFAKEKNITLDQAISIFQLESIDKRIEANNNITIDESNMNGKAIHFVNNIYKSFQGCIIESTNLIKDYYAKIIVHTDLSKEQIIKVLKKINEYLPSYEVSTVSHLDKISSSYSTMFILHKAAANTSNKNIEIEHNDMTEILMKSSNSHYSNSYTIEDNIGSTKLILIDKELVKAKEERDKAPLFTKDQIVQLVDLINTKGYVISDIEENKIKFSNYQLDRFSFNQMGKLSKEYELTSIIDHNKGISKEYITYKKNTYVMLYDREKIESWDCEKILKQTIKALN